MEPLPQDCQWTGVSLQVPLVTKGKYTCAEGQRVVGFLTSNKGRALRGSTPQQLPVSTAVLGEGHTGNERSLGTKSASVCLHGQHGWSFRKLGVYLDLQ